MIISRWICHGLLWETTRLTVNRELQPQQWLMTLIVSCDVLLLVLQKLWMMIRIRVCPTTLAMRSFFLQQTRFNFQDSHTCSQQHDVCGVGIII
jgi:hypothetical protein